MMEEEEADDCGDRANWKDWPVRGALQAALRIVNRVVRACAPSFTQRVILKSALDERHTEPPGQFSAAFNTNMITFYCKPQQFFLWPM